MYSDNAIITRRLDKAKLQTFSTPFCSLHTNQTTNVNQKNQATKKRNEHLPKVNQFFSKTNFSLQLLPHKKSFCRLCIGHVLIHNVLKALDALLQVLQKFLPILKNVRLHERRWAVK